MKRSSPKSSSSTSQIMILTVTVLVNLFAVGIGGYFFYDLVIVPRLDLRTPEEKVARFVRIITSPVREPAEQIKAMDQLESLRNAVSADLYRQAVSTIEESLARMVVAREVIDHWLALHRRRVERIEYHSLEEIESDWRPDDPRRSAARQRFWMNWQARCDDHAARLIGRSVTGGVPEIETRIAAAALVRLRAACAQAGTP